MRQVVKQLMRHQRDDMQVDQTGLHHLFGGADSHLLSGIWGQTTPDPDRVDKCDATEHVHSNRWGRPPPNCVRTLWTNGVPGAERLSEGVVHGTRRVATNWMAHR